MKKQVFLLLMSTFIVCSFLTDCSDDLGMGADFTDPTKGLLTLNFSLSEVTTRAETTVDGANYENKINRVDIFFFASDATDATQAVYALHDEKPLEEKDATTSKNHYKTSVGVNTLREALNDETAAACKVVAVANCNLTRLLTNPTLSELKTITVTDKEEGYSFRSTSDANDFDFVMTNFAQADNVATWTDEGGSADVKLKRVAAKIRVALDVEEKIIDDKGVEWESDRNDMRLFIRNGVTKARLDGSHEVELGIGDYYSIVTSGSKGNTDGNAQNTGDYILARKITNPGTPASGEPAHPGGETYPYYNTLPYYTYPNRWENNVLETTQTTLTIVVPWQRTEGEKTIYRPSYYTIPVNNGTTIESNKYYYIRMHIGMMGSVTPEKPMEVEMQCEIVDWGKADDTNVNIRPVRYLVFNQTEFEMNNTTEIEIPFMSTHDCEVVKCEGQYSNFYIKNGGVETIMQFSDTSTKINGSSAIGENYEESKFCSHQIDNENQVLKFRHNFFDIYSVTRSGSTVQTVTRSSSNTETSSAHRFYSKFEVTLVVRHKSNETDIDKAYEETIKLTIYPAIYYNTEEITNAVSGDGSWENNGWIYVNGYGTTDSQTSYLGMAGHGAGGGDNMDCITTLTITRLNEEESLNWSIDDPRTYYINNLLSGTAHLKDAQNSDNETNWTTTFNGSNLTSSRTVRNVVAVSGAKTMWEHFPNVEDRIWSGGIWSASQDKSSRALKYYYPCSEDEKKEDILAPKIVVASYHGYTNVLSREEARRRCASYQQYGYPAGRWRLPTFAEYQFIKNSQRIQVIKHIFNNHTTSASNGAYTQWTNRGIAHTNSSNVTELTGDITNKSYVRCVYDLWYWEKVDKNGVSTGRIPEGTNRENWKYYTWGDRPKENPLTSTPQTRGGGDSYTIQDYLEENSPGNYAITRDGNKVKREKMK